jgi:hypothetical protein
LRLLGKHFGGGGALWAGGELYDTVGS